MTKIPVIIEGAPYSYLMEGATPNIYRLFLRVFVPRGQKIIWSAQQTQNPDTPTDTTIEGIIVDGNMPIQSSPWALIPIDVSAIPNFDAATHTVTISVTNGTEVRQDTIFFEDADPPQPANSFNTIQAFNAPYMYLHGVATSYNTPDVMYVPRCCFVLKGEIVDRRFTYKSNGDYTSQIFIQENLNAPALEVNASLLYPNHIEYFANANGDGSFIVDIGPEVAPPNPAGSLMPLMVAANSKKKGRRRTSASKTS